MVRKKRGHSAEQDCFKQSLSLLFLNLIKSFTKVSLIGMIPSSLRRQLWSHGLLSPLPATHQRFCFQKELHEKFSANLTLSFLTTKQLQVKLNHVVSKLKRSSPEKHHLQCCFLVAPANTFSALGVWTDSHYLFTKLTPGFCTVQRCKLHTKKERSTTGDSTRSTCAIKRCTSVCKQQGLGEEVYQTYFGKHSNKWAYRFWASY